MRKGRAPISMLLAAALAVPAPAAADRFIATSGVPHRDLADVTGLPGWDPWDGASTSPAWEAAVDGMLSTMAAESGVDATLMTGDLVAGYWGRDDTRSGVFGPVRTTAQQRAAVRRAARAYYGELQRDWAAHPGLGPVLPAMGDHEAGDLPPSGWRPRGSHQHRMFPTAVSAWTDAFGRLPTYALQVPGPQDVIVATLLPVRWSPSGLTAAVGPRQLAWLETVFRGHDGWKVVQVEIPPSPVQRSRHSSGTVLADGEALWQKARELGVHVIFAAEVHDLNAMRQPGFETLPGPVLVTNGGALYGGRAHYVVGDVSDEALTLTARTVSCSQSGTERLWQTTLARRPRSEVACTSRAPVTGRLELTRHGEVTSAEGTLALPPVPGLPPAALPWPEGA